MFVLNSVGKPVWLALMCIAFIWFWPLGLAILFYLSISGRLGSWNSTAWRTPSAWFGSGNVAFDEHRHDVLEQLDKEAKDFTDFREQLAKAKDRTEFDQFMKRGKKK